LPGVGLAAELSIVVTFGEYGREDKEVRQKLRRTFMHWSFMMRYLARQDRNSVATDQLLSDETENIMSLILRKEGLSGVRQEVCAFKLIEFPVTHSSVRKLIRKDWAITSCKSTVNCLPEGTCHPSFSKSTTNSSDPPVMVWRHCVW